MAAITIVGGNTLLPAPVLRCGEVLVVQPPAHSSSWVQLAGQPHPRPGSFSWAGLSLEPSWCSWNYTDKISALQSDKLEGRGDAVMLQRDSPCTSFNWEPLQST